MTPVLRIQVSDGLTAALSRLVAETRHDLGWTQTTLAERAGISRQRISRLERGSSDLTAIDRALDALGLRCMLEVEGRHLEERRLQRDIVHAALIAAIAKRLRRAGWQVETEIPTGPGAPTGWIDILAFRPDDAALLIIEVKTRLDDIGGLQRQISFYEREAGWAARRLGWRAAVTRSVVICLDSDEVATSIAVNQQLLAAFFPGHPAHLGAWIMEPGRPAPAPGQRTLATAELGRRRTVGLLRTSLSGRRGAPTYRGYADVASRITSAVAARGR